MALCDDVRAHCARIAGSARSVAIDVAALTTLAAAPTATLDPAIHYLDGPREAVARYLLTLDSINFGSGWFPILRKRSGCCAGAASGHATAAPPKSVMNSRRLMSVPKLRRRYLSGSIEYFDRG